MNYELTDTEKSLVLEIMEQEIPWLFERTPLVQMMCVHYQDPDNNKPLSGVFDKPEPLAQHAFAANLQGYQVWYMLNQIRPNVEITNALQRGEALGNEDIVQRVRVMLDVDPEKQEGQGEAT